MAGELRALVDELGAAVAARWGEPARYDLEVRAGLLPELGAERERVGAAAWEAAVAELLAGPRPRVIAQALLAALRRRPRFEREIAVSADHVVERPAVTLTPYHRRLLELARLPAVP